MSKATVALVRCESYDRPMVEQALRRAVDLLGGPARFVQPGERIVLKPNVLFPSDPRTCVATHPEVLRAAGLVLGQAGAKLSYGDAATVLPVGLNMRRAGLADCAAELGMALCDFEHPVTVEHPKGLIARRLVLARGVVEADGLVSLPKFKTHNLVRFTGAVKNQYGCIPGMAKGRYHAQYPDPYDFSKLLVDINTYVKPRLCVMDAIEAMEGDGPGSGDPKHLGLLMASADFVAVDAVSCRLMELPPEYVPTIRWGAEAGLGCADIQSIELVGDPLEEFVDKAFKVVRRPPVPMKRGALRRAVRNLVSPRPVVLTKRCIRCGKCIQMCPVEPKAVDWGPRGKQRPPAHDYTTCIRCFCCSEFCPEKALVVRTPLVGRLLPPIGYLSLLASRIVGRRRTA